MFALVITFNDSRHTRIVRTHLTAPEAVERAVPGAVICEVPDTYCSILEQPFGQEADALLKYIDNLPEEEKVYV